MTDFLERWATESDEHARLLAEERLITQVTEALWDAMEKAGASKTELAARLGKSKGYVSQLFSGTRNMTLRTLADICFALDQVATVQVNVKGSNGSWQTVPAPEVSTGAGRIRYARTGDVVAPLDFCKTAA